MYSKCPKCGLLKILCICNDKDGVLNPPSYLDLIRDIKIKPIAPTQFPISGGTQEYNSYDPFYRTTYDILGRPTGRVVEPFGEIRNLLDQPTGFKLDACSNLSKIQYPKIANPFLKNDPEDPSGFGGSGGFTPP